MKPSGMDAAGFEPEGEGERGHSSTWLYNLAERRGRKTSSTWKIMEAAPNALLKQIQLQLAS